MEIKSTKTVASSRFTALIVGPSGVGKTSLAKTLDPTETLIISAESGLLCLSGTDIDVIEIKTSDDLKNVYMYLIENKDKGKYKNVFIDSLTEVAEIILNELKTDTKYQDPKMALKMWMSYSEKMTMWVKLFRDMTGRNVILTCLNEMKADGLDKIETFNIPGNSVKNNIKAWFDLVLSYQVFNHEGQTYRKLVTDIEKSPLSKDRSGKLETYEEADLSIIMEKILGV